MSFVETTEDDSEPGDEERDEDNGVVVPVANTEEDDEDIGVDI